MKIISFALSVIGNKSKAGKEINESRPIATCHGCYTDQTLAVKDASGTFLRMLASLTASSDLCFRI